MALSNEHKEKLSEAIKILVKTIDSLEDVPADFRALDAIDIAISLFEQQITQDIEFSVETLMGQDKYKLDIEMLESENDELASPDGDDNIISPQGSSIVDKVMQNMNPTSLENVDFRFIENKKDDPPSVDELKEWFDAK